MARDLTALRIEGGLPVGPDGRIHTVYRHDPSTLRLSAAAPNLTNCYSADTQVLTRKGWVFFSELESGEAVAQIDNGSISFVVPERLIQREYAGPMIRLKAEYMDLLVTPDHRMFARKRSGANEFTPASSWLNRPRNVDRFMVRGGKIVGGKKLTQEERKALALAVLVQAEGHVRPDTPSIECALKSPRKQRQLKLLGKERVRTRKKDICLWVHPDEVKPWLLWPEKVFNIPKLLKLCVDDLEWFLDQVMQWDGDSRLKRNYGQIAKREKAVEAVQLAAVLSEHSTSWRVQERLGYSDFHTVNLHPKSNRRASFVDVTEEPYVGRVYCVTVPCGVILVRRNRDIVACGNCPRGSTDLQKLVRGFFVAPEGSEFNARDYSGIEGVLTGFFANASRVIRLFKLDGHSFVTAHILHLIDKVLPYSDLPQESWSNQDLKEYLKKIKKEYKERREINKKITHGANYMETARMAQVILLNELGKLYPVKEIAKVIDAYYEILPEIPRWHLTLASKVGGAAPKCPEQLWGCEARNTYIRTPFNVVHRYYDVVEWKKTPNGWEWDFGTDAKRLASLLPQSTARFCLTRAAQRIWNNPETQDVARTFRLFIHDELFCENPIGMGERIQAVLKEEMERPIPELKLPDGSLLTLGTEGKAGRVWAEMKGVA